MTSITIPYIRRHQARPGDIVDCTKRAKGLKPCPKCGKLAEVHNYTGKNEGEGMAVHALRRDSFYWTVTKACHWHKGEIK